MKRFQYLFATMTMLAWAIAATADRECGGEGGLSEGFCHPQDSARTKVWWFFGEGPTTRAGITADLEAFRRQGIGGVVYYDQVHGKGVGADKLFSTEWWQHLVFAAQEAKRLGLSFEANVGNGYVAGGAWITPDCSMQRLVMTETLTEEAPLRLQLPEVAGWHENVAVLAVPYTEQKLGSSKLLHIEPTPEKGAMLVFDFGRTFTARSVTYSVTQQGKAPVLCMQVPATHQPLDQTDPTRFFGCGFRELKDVGVLEVSDDGVSYRTVCRLPAKYKNMGGVRQQTVAFKTTKGRFFRLRRTTDEQLTFSDAQVSAWARIDRWEEKASLTANYIDDKDTIRYEEQEMVSLDSIVDLTDRLATDGSLTWDRRLEGRWLVLRLAAVSTGGRTKHGRAEGLGLECDKLSVRGARMHWKHYTQPLVDSIRAHGAEIAGICMDSHEAGPQNWTHDMTQQFKRLRGYDMTRLLPVMAGGLVVYSRHQEEPSARKFLYDLRRTISDLVAENYYGEFQRLCRKQGLTLTAQAIGNALTLAGDNIAVKKAVDKPQGEFWGYQTEGNYDIKDCSSAAHVYGKLIASGEAFTDISYRHSLAEVKNLADYAFASGINELVVCASAYQPDVQPPFTINTANGRQYVLNRMNTLFPFSRPFWDYQARCAWMLRQGKPVADFCLYLGDDVPKKILAHLLPPIPQGYNFDACTTDVLLHRLQVKDGLLVLPDGVSYRMLLLPRDEELTPAVRQRVEELVRAGAKVWDPHSGISLEEALAREGLMPDVDVPSAHQLYAAHRQAGQQHIYFLNNHSDSVVTGPCMLRAEAAVAERWDPVNGTIERLDVTHRQGGTAIRLSLAPRESCFIVLSPQPTVSAAEAWSNGRLADSLRQPATGHVSCLGAWQVQFDPECGGPVEPVSLDSLTDWTQHPDPRIRYYAGTAIYTNSFRLSRKDCSARHTLSIDQPGAVVQVVVNGQEAGVLWCAPWRIDITPFVKKGRNCLQLRVANTLWNRLVGDASRPAPARISPLTHDVARPGDSLVPSGLVGEVRIEQYE